MSAVRAHRTNRIALREKIVLTRRKVQSISDPAPWSNMPSPCGEKAMASGPTMAWGHRCFCLKEGYGESARSSGTTVAIAGLNRLKEIWMTTKDRSERGCLLVRQQLKRAGIATVRLPEGGIKPGVKKKAHPRAAPWIKEDERTRPSGGRHEPSHAAGVVPCPEVVVARFGVTFFAGRTGPGVRVFCSTIGG
jgi:hypothetical protein